MKQLDWIPQKQLSEEQKSRIQLIQAKLDQIQQDVPEFENTRKNLSLKKDEFIKQAESVFQKMQQEIIKSISNKFDEFENELFNYQKYQHYITSCCQQMQQYLNTQIYNFTISNQAQRICNMNLNALNLIGQKVKQSYEQDENNLDSFAKYLLADIEDILQKKIKQKRFSSTSDIQSILEDLNQLQLRINPLDQKEEDLRILSSQQENLLKYFHDSQQQQSQRNIVKDNSSQNIIQLALEQLEQIQAQDELNQNTENNNLIQKDIIDACLPISLQNFQKDYNVIKTSHIFKEYPQRFNPQQISIPNIATDSYYSKKLIVGGWDGQIELFDVSGDLSQKIIKQLFDGPVKVIAFIKSSQLVCVSGCEQSREHPRIYLLDQNNLEIIHIIELQQGEKVVEILELNKNENILVSQLIIVSETSIYLYSLTDYKQLKSFTIKQNVLKAQILQDNIFLSNQSGNIFHYILNEDLQLVNTIQIHSDWIHLLSILESNENIVSILSGSYDKKVALREYNIVTKELKLISELSNEFSQSLLQIDSQRFIISYANILNFYEGNKLKNKLIVYELDEIQQMCLIQNHLAISGKSDNSNIVII
ncbi:hypothetical protein TTHERM_00049110 (macronuclear) [Tetrahymena thermophila SB210]|uniref:Uncharacterized protein n=1 Tax=Tetrahymena thermophila (strain SB210) TaxID=312017 RepID=Q23D80_TETTS|nr:hypothetical protein TTHERM_00049110 [Tetrahymena thermophila SB210]EAR94559.2 hypothetical protein TTHERM_00049110 [Tetrahymena thermophila SB210]|eukprot:XP_001014806.2 hypothetical protein TTHERM_00049110 [Tetrahymena thermophila SB210]